MYVLTDKARAVLAVLQDTVGEDLTAQEVAAKSGVEPRSITGVLNAMARKTKTHEPLVFREEVEGMKAKVIRLTEVGAATDPDAEMPEEDAE